MKRLFAFVIMGFATAAVAFGAVAGGSADHDWNGSMARGLPGFLHYHPTDGSALRKNLDLTRVQPR